MTNRPELPTLLPATLPRGLASWFGRRPRVFSRGSKDLIDLAQELDIRPLALLSEGAPKSLGPVTYLVHEPAAPDLRARLFERLASGLRSGGPRVRALNPGEWHLALGAAGPQRAALAPPLWGELPAGPSLTPPERHRAALREVVGDYLDSFQSALARSDGTAQLWAEAIRDRLEELGNPSQFPPRLSSSDASSGSALDKELHTSVIGALHAVLGAAVPPSLPDSPSTAPAQLDFDDLSPELGDLLRSLRGDLRRLPELSGPSGLYLLPDALGALGSWWLVAVVPNEAPVDLCARLSSRLREHGELLDSRHRSAAFGRGRLGPVITMAMARALFTGGLHPRPLKNQLGSRRLVLGDDVLAQLSPLEKDRSDMEDLRIESAEAILAVGRLWNETRPLNEVTCLMYGRLPRLIDLARGGNLERSQRDLLEEWSGSSDPAQAFAGRHGLTMNWADAATVDLGRSREFLRDYGPMLIRLRSLLAETILS